MIRTDRSKASTDPLSMRESYFDLIILEKLPMKIELFKYSQIIFINDNYKIVKER